MSMIRRAMAAVWAAVIWVTAAAQGFTAVDSLMAWHAATAENSGLIQQEMIYLHLDNTAYFRGDRIYFACYLVTSGKLQPSNMSKTVYVELLNPNGQVIDRQTLRAVDGRCHGSLLVEEQPFYSGYYEIRAYTRYMLNFGPEAIYSRVIPVYKAPEVEGNWTDRSMLDYGSPKHEFSRPKPTKTNKVDAGFYPEGGRLVQGRPARVAFELTDESRRPLQGSGRVVDRRTDSVVATFASGHMGRGAFDFTPTDSKYRAEVECQGKRYSVDLPSVEPEGLTVRVDALTHEDSVTVTASCSPGFATKTLGASLTCRGVVYGRAVLDLSEEGTAQYVMPKAKLPTGVVTLTVFDPRGRVLADRMFFNDRHDMVQVECSFDKEQYATHEQVQLSVSLSRAVPFSISVTDGENQVAYGSNMMADLLLSSEIRGYVHNPAYYLDDPEALDRLLMVQGWRRYPWTQLAGVEPYSIEIMPEQGIEVHGRVLSRSKDKPLTDVTVAAMINRVVDDTMEPMPLFADNFEVDADGRFSFIAEVPGECMLSLSSLKKGKAQPSRILLDTVKRLPARGYDRGEMCADLDTLPHGLKAAEAPEVQQPFHDPNSRLLREVTVTERVTPWDSVQIIENAVARYDFVDERSAMLDEGQALPRTLGDALMAMDSGFYIVNKSEIGSLGQDMKVNRYRELRYRGGEPMFIVWGPMAEAWNIKNGGMVETLYNELDRIVAAPWEIVSMDYVKDLYISTDRRTIREYELRNENGMLPDSIKGEKRYSCVVFIESGNGLRRALMTDKGMRRAAIRGYDSPVEFYAPDYSDSTLFESDVRRTLYWNPEVTPDNDGKSTLRFFNNSTPGRRLTVSTAGI